MVPQISTRPFELWTRLDSPGTAGALAADVDGGGAGRRCGAACARWPPTPTAGTTCAGRGRPCRVEPGLLRALGPCAGALLPPAGRAQGEDLAALSAERGADPIDLLLDLALADDFETQVATVMRNGDDDEVARLVAHPAAMIGASDAGAHVLANTDSCYAVWTLQHWVRERQVLSLERAVAMLTGDQARLLGLDRPGAGASRAGRRPRAVRPRPDRHHRSALRRRPARGRPPPGDRRRRRRDERGQRRGGHAPGSLDRCPFRPAAAGRWA